MAKLQLFVWECDGIRFCIKKFGVFSLENQQNPVFHKDEEYV